MNIEQVRNIEQTLELKLPSDYVQIITNYPSKLSSTEAPDFGLLDDPDKIIQENKYVLENGACGGPWPMQYFIIGINGCGDYYVIKHQESKFSVGFADHEVASIDFYAKDLEDFTEKLLKEMNG